MTFSKRYLDSDEYVSLTTASERSGYSVSYLSRLVKAGKIAKAPIDAAILVSVESLDAFTDRLTGLEMEALKVAAAYGTVVGSGKNRYGPKAGAIRGSVAPGLVERGYLERLRDQFNMSVYCITDKGKARVKR